MGVSIDELAGELNARMKRTTRREGASKGSSFPMNRRLEVRRRFDTLQQKHAFGLRECRSICHSRHAHREPIAMGNAGFETKSGLGQALLAG